MRPEALPSLSRALTLAQTYVKSDQDAVVVILSNATDSAFVAFDYWACPESFERQVGQAGLASGASGGTLIAPLVCQRDDVTQARTGLSGPLTESEVEILWIFSFDVTSGFDIARCRYERLDGVAVFTEPELLLGDASLTPNAPGFTLLQTFLSITD